MAHAHASSSHDRELDLVLFGATGFTGQLVADYLAAKSAREPFAWAIAGRTRDKLEGVRDQIKSAHPELVPPELIIAESFDRESLRAMAERARVICSTVGPYAKYGDDLVDICVEQDTDYCDLTGETFWVRRMIEAHHEEASRGGTRIVHCCGFDSIPSDLGVWMVQQHAITEHGAPCDEVRFYLNGARGGISGGTVESMVNLFEEGERDREVLRAAAHPYTLNPPDQRRGVEQPSDMRYGYDKEIDAWVGPFFMASVNTRVVRRTNALLASPYGEAFRYSEAMRTKSGLSGMVGATAMAGGFGALGAALAFKPTRELLKKLVLPKAGEGPSQEQMESGYFSITLIGAVKGSKHRVKGEIYVKRDPGYGGTSLMLAEAAHCLARDREALDASEALFKGGVLTPASAMGDVLLSRLREAGMTFDVGAPSA